MMAITASAPITMKIIPTAGTPPLPGELTPPLGGGVTHAGVAVAQLHVATLAVELPQLATHVASIEGVQPHMLVLLLLH